MTSNVEGSGCGNAYWHDIKASREEGAREALRNVWDAMVSPHAVGLDIEATRIACAQVERVAREMGVGL